MKLYSTNNKSELVDFKQAVFQSLPQDKGLYMIDGLSTLNADFLNHIEDYNLQEIAKEVTTHLLSDDIPSEDLKRLVEDAVNFDAPLVFLEDDLAVLELFHGPSLAFKDFGARFMSRIMGYLNHKSDKVLDILVATSGDTGGAVALGFLGVEGTRVTILYPKGKVSPIQELQLTTNGQNIRAIEIDGTFDDCQALVKQAFLDDELKSTLNLTSANSINISRLIPQTFYYFNALAEAKRKGFDEVSFVVPSGNFGNIGAGILAHKMGMKVKQFVAATNANDTVPRFLEEKVYQPKDTKATLSNAMDVSNPSNWVRIMDLFNQEVEDLKDLVKSKSYSDEETKAAIEDIYKRYNYVACPHTAIAWLAAKEYQASKENNKELIVFLSTAHPCKFPNVFSEEIQTKIEIPESVKEIEDKPSFKSNLSTEFEALKSWLIEYN